MTLKNLHPGVTVRLGKTTPLFKTHMKIRAMSLILIELNCKGVLTLIDRDSDTDFDKNGCNDTSINPFLKTWLVLHRE